MKSQRQFSSRWFRVYDESVDDPKIQMLSDRLHRFLFNCWCMASKHGGYLPPVNEIAWRLRTTEVKISAMIAELHERGLLDREADTFSPHNWCARQYDSDVSTKRVRAFRERKRNADETFPKRDETVSETPPEQNRAETDADTEQSNNDAPKTGALSLVPASDRGSVVRPAVSPRRKNRTTEEITKALGERLLWWEEFWKIYPCHEGTRAAMDAFERRVKDRATAEAVYRGAKAYAQRLCANPEIIPKWGQGWINDERWLDENRVRDPPAHAMSKTDQVKALALKNLQEHGVIL